MRFEWTERALVQIQKANTAIVGVVLAVVIVPGAEAKYERWRLSLAVILGRAMCLLCSVDGVMAAKMDINISRRSGFVVLIAWRADAILIVRFAKNSRDVLAPAPTRRMEAVLFGCGRFMTRSLHP